jgi:hypothetical protein
MNPTVLADEDFKAALALIPDLDMYAASVDRAGKFRMLHITQHGHSVVREAQFPLESIFAPRKKEPSVPAVPLRDKKIDRDLPVILSMEEFPFRLSHEFEAKRLALSAKGVLYAATRDGRLTRRDRVKCGPIQLTDKVPYGAVRKVLTNGETEVMVVIDPQQRSNLLLFCAIMRPDARVPCVETKTVTLDARGNIPDEIMLQNGLLVMLYEHVIEVFDPNDGKRLSRYDFSSPPAKQWSHDRFFRKIGAAWIWYEMALSTPAGQVTMCDLEQDSQENTIACIDRRDGLSCWTLSTSGRLMQRLHAGKRERIQFDLKGQWIERLIGVSDDGNRLIVSCSKGVVLGLDAKTMAVATLQGVSEYSDFCAFWLEPTFSELAVRRNLRNDFSHVSISHNGSLILEKGIGKAFFIEYAASRPDRLVIKKWIETSRIDRIPFVKTSRPPGVRYRLSVARFPDGSCVYLDSRGLLHLKSADKGVPEIALVLFDQEVTGWCSNGVQCGDDYFLRDVIQKTTPAHFLDSRIRQFTRRQK